MIDRASPGEGRDGEAVRLRSMRVTVVDCAGEEMGKGRDLGLYVEVDSTREGNEWDFVWLGLIW